jgi:hypothetical protein
MLNIHQMSIDLRVYQKPHPIHASIIGSLTLLCLPLMSLEFESNALTHIHIKCAAMATTERTAANERAVNTLACPQNRGSFGLTE